MRVRRSRNPLRFPRFEGAQLVGELLELANLACRTPPISESETRADEAELACYLGPPLSPRELLPPTAVPHPRLGDGRSRRASFKQWLREHTPLVYAGLYDDRLLERARRAQLERVTRERREALAYCIECHNPLLATEDGFQFCPYGRARQHEKLRSAFSAPTAQKDKAAVLDSAALRASGGHVSRQSAICSIRNKAQRTVSR
jgi:hypothetical protein